MTLPRGPWPRAAAIVALAAACWAGTLWNDLVWDDRLTAATPSPWPQPGRWWRPVVMASFLADRALTGGVAWGMHLTNVAAHAAVGVLLDGWLRALGLASGTALAATAAFVAHPVQSEAVAYVSGRTDVLCAAFVLLALRVWRRVRRTWDAAAWATAGLVVAALGCKEAAVLVPLVLLVAGAPTPAPADGPRPVPVLPMLAAASWVALFAARGGPELHLDGLPARIPAAASMLLDYVRLLVWPADLHLERFVAVGGRSPVRAAALLAGAAAVAGTVIGAARRVHGGRVLLALAVATYLPVCGLVPVYPAIAGRAVFAAEHFLYLPLLGVAPLAAGAIASVWPPRARRLAPAVVAALVAAWATASWLRVRDWRNEETLFRHTLRYDPPVARVWYDLGNLRLQAGDPAEAARLYEAALARAPRDAAVHLNLGIALQRLGRRDEALAHYAEALRLDPSLAAAFRPPSR